MQALYPVGKVYVSITSTNPATLFGFGTWEAFGAGRVMVCLNSGDTDFDTLGETGGEKTHVLTESEITAHSHKVNPPQTTSSGQSATHTHTYYTKSGTGNTASNNVPNWKGTTTINMGNASAGHTHTFDIAEFNSGNVGSGTAHNNMQPSIAVYLFKRTA